MKFENQRLKIAKLTDGGKPLLYSDVFFLKFASWEKLYKEYIQKMFRKKLFIVLPLMVALSVNSCFYEDYGIEKADFSDSWNFQLTTPLFYGNVELKDLIGKTYSGDSYGDGNIILEFSNDSSVAIPIGILSEPHIFLNNFPLYIADDYQISEGNFKFIVSNGCPYPLNLQIEFHTGGSRQGILFSPPPFAAADMINDTLRPVTTIQQIAIGPDQLSFIMKNRVRFISWFNTPDSIPRPEKLSAHSPVEISIILSATITQDEE